MFSPYGTIILNLELTLIYEISLFVSFYTFFRMSGLL